MSAIDDVKLPFGSEGPDPNTVYLIPIDLIGVPSLRVTSTFDEDQTAELIESLKTEGQRDPVKCVWFEGKIILSDGFNRIAGLAALDVKVVKALIRPGKPSDCQIENIITARHRGKENPAQTAEVIKDLIENEHLDKHEVKARLGLSDGAFRTLYAISGLPQEVKDLIKYGKLGVGAAFHIAQLSEVMQQITLANQAVNWGYTVDQVKAAVIQLLNPDFDKAKSPVVFDPDGKPNIVFPKCTGCAVELQAIIYPLNCCADCYQAAKDFFSAYFAPAVESTPAPAPEATAPKVQSGFIQD